MKHIDANAPEIESYQRWFIDRVARVIELHWLRRHPLINILDNGCDPTGKQLWHLSKLCRGSLVGTNIMQGFPSAEAIATAGANVSLACMDGMKLDYEDSSFDMVVSSNVLEHVDSPDLYLRECARVLKPTGVAFFQTAPIWDGPRGHHIHEEMIHRICPLEQNFRNDGTVIPDWGHLHYSKSELAIVISQKLRPETVEYILHYIYDTKDLNRVSWAVIRESLQRWFAQAEIAPWRTDLSGMESSNHNVNNCDVTGFSATCYPRPRSPFRHRIMWNVRRLGV